MQYKIKVVGNGRLAAQVLRSKKAFKNGQIINIESPASLIEGFMKQYEGTLEFVEDYPAYKPKENKLLKTTTKTKRK